MQKVIVRGEAVYKCTVCNRKIRVPSNRKGLDVLHNCTITSGCLGKLKKISQMKDINNTPTLTPSVPGVRDWIVHDVVYTHTQSVGSTVWDIQHNLHSRPIIHVYTRTLPGDELVLVPIEQFNTVVLDSNRVQLTFDRAQSGVAQLVALASPNTTNPQSTEVEQQLIVNVQESTDSGLITIGTLLQTALIDLTIRYTISNNNILDIIYDDLDNTPATSSPWIGARVAVVDGKKYAIRSVDLKTYPNAAPHFISGEIPPQGAFMCITAINTTPPNPRDVILLGAKSPFSSVDRIYNQYVDFSKETPSSSNVIYSYGKVFAKSDIIKTIYPFITVV
jgi:hypothetical protein